MDKDIAFAVGLIIQRIAVKLDDENYNKVKDDLNDLNKKILDICEIIDKEGAKQ